MPFPRAAPPIARYACAFGPGSREPPAFAGAGPLRAVRARALVALPPLLGACWAPGASGAGICSLPQAAQDVSAVAACGITRFLLRGRAHTVASVDIFGSSAYAFT